MASIRQGIGSRVLPCGCRAGVYETYDGRVVTILDVRAPSCTDREHEAGRVVRAGDAGGPDSAFGSTRR